STLQITGVAVFFSITSSDNCSSSVITTPASGSVFPIGITTVTSVATDASGNTSTCSFDVNVIDNVPPSVSCPSDTTVSSDPGICGAIVNFIISTNPAWHVVSTPASGSIFPVGTTTVTSIITHGHQTLTCSFN